VLVLGLVLGLGLGLLHMCTYIHSGLMTPLSAAPGTST
jgi:hypothetical protein